MDEVDRVSFDLDGPLAIIGNLVKFALEVFKPVVAAVTEIAGEGPTGFIVVFVIFFSIYLVRMSARSGRTDVFGYGMRAIGGMGVAASLCYLGLMAAELLLLPTLVAGVTLTANSLTGAEPTLSQFVTLVGSPSTARDNLVADFLRFHEQERSILPLRFRPSLIVLAAFGCMWLVGRAIGRITSDRAPT